MPPPQNKQRGAAAIDGGTRAEANIDDVFENVTAAVKRSNGVIIVTMWIANLHFLRRFRTQRRLSFGPLFCFVLFFILLSETVVVHSRCLN